MKMDFEYDKVDGLAKALGGRIELLEKLFVEKGLSDEQVERISESDFSSDFFTVYGFHIDSNESDSSAAVTYLSDAVGMTPAYMDLEAGEFNYGSWENAFFMPRPCMLKYDGTVDYYLDPNDYSKKEDGTASDVADDTYEGNAMMEWGRDGKQIWYKIAPDEDNERSASIYISDYKADENFHAWSFINNQGVLVDHFYTPIYNGTLDSDGKLRSISGKESTALCQRNSAGQQITAAEKNNPGEDKLWFIEVYSDVILINLLLVLIGKSLDTQDVFGYGNAYTGATAAVLRGTGTLDDKGLFYGDHSHVTSVKVFGMENWWGNQMRRTAGLIAVDRHIYYKLTRGTEDGSTATDYNYNGEGYIDSEVYYNQNFEAVIARHVFRPDGSMVVGAYTGYIKSFYTDYFAIQSGTNYAFRGGTPYYGMLCGAFAVSVAYNWEGVAWWCGAAPSCKPLAPTE